MSRTDATVSETGDAPAAGTNGVRSAATGRADWWSGDPLYEDWYDSATRRDVSPEADAFAEAAIALAACDPHEAADALQESDSAAGGAADQAIDAMCTAVKRLAHDAYVAGYEAARNQHVRPIA